MGKVLVGNYEHLLVDWLGFIQNQLKLNRGKGPDTSQKPVESRSFGIL